MSEFLPAFINSNPNESIPQEDELDYKFAKNVVSAILSGGGEAYFVGGYARDLILGEKPKDIDIATSLSPEAVLKLDLPGINFKYIEAAEAYPVVQANMGETILEIASFRKDKYSDLDGTVRRPEEMIVGATLDEDAQRRDFSINALYYNPITEEILDPTKQGLKDLKDKKIRFVGDAITRINEDKVRLLRAIRFKNRFGLSYETNTYEALEKECPLIQKISKERLRVELTRILQDPHRQDALKDLDRFGMLELILPEFTAGKGIAQPSEYHSEGDVFKHQMLVMQNLSNNPSSRLVWAALLHDIGKPHTQTVDDNGKIHFYDHAKWSGILARKVLQRLRMPNDEIEEVCWLVENHMSVREFPKMSRAKQIGYLQPYRKNSKLKSPELFDDLIKLLQADDASSLRPENKEIKDSVTPILEIVSKIRSEIDHLGNNIKNQFELDGNFFIDRYSLEKSDPRLKDLKNLIQYLNDVYLESPQINKDALIVLGDQWWNGPIVNETEPFAEIGPILDTKELARIEKLRLDGIKCLNEALSEEPFFQYRDAEYWFNSHRQGSIERGGIKSYLENDVPMGKNYYSIYLRARHQVFVNHDDIVAWQILKWCIEKNYVSREKKRVISNGSYLSSDEYILYPALESWEYTVDYLADDVDFEIPSSYTNLPDYIEPNTIEYIEEERAIWQKEWTRYQDFMKIAQPLLEKAQQVSLDDSFPISLLNDRWKLEYLSRSLPHYSSDMEVWILEATNTIKMVEEHLNRELFNKEQQNKRNAEIAKQEEISFKPIKDSLNFTGDNKKELEFVRNIFKFSKVILKEANNDYKKVLAILDDEISASYGRARIQNSLKEKLPGLANHQEARFILESSKASEVKQILNGAFAMLDDEYKSSSNPDTVKKINNNPSENNILQDLKTVPSSSGEENLNEKLAALKRRFEKH